jgi:alpha-amylase/alpha-mannosidase (GH57 family)
MDRFVCIHGHFYQPPRENPWLEEVELQEEAAPYHDWNERITNESYAPNMASRVVESDGLITDIVNNYAMISFDFGPTLLSWMERRAPEVYRAILEADRLSLKRYSGHGSAIAQIYNHMIMPLANRRDKYTQAKWGIRDFEKRFGRSPEGMWLPETAVDIETLEALAELQIKFSILAPHQAAKIRKIGASEWIDVTGSRIDSRHPYLCRLPSGKTITLFFYDHSISHDIAFGDILRSGDRFAKRLAEAVGQEDHAPLLVNVATDGETYGHHHLFGDMALSYCLYSIESNCSLNLTNYGEFLERAPPTYEVSILPNTSWSCSHGIKRWDDDCGCNTGSHPGWNQSWRHPLREGMNWLRDQVTPLFETDGLRLLKDPWAARDDYIDVLLDRSRSNVEEFLEHHSTKKLSKNEKITALKLLEIQRHTLLLYTSCGWFFDEISEIGTVQVMQYAARVIQLAREISGVDLELGYLGLLRKALSNSSHFNGGADVFERRVKPLAVDLVDVGVHHAISSLFDRRRPKRTKEYSYAIEDQTYELAQSGHLRLAVGASKVSSDITWEESTVVFAVLWLGDHNVFGGFRQSRNKADISSLRETLNPALNGGDTQKLIRLIDKTFTPNTCSLRDLFKDEQRRIIDHILRISLNDFESDCRRIVKNRYQLLRFLKDIGIDPPKELQSAAEVAIGSEIRKVLASKDLDLSLLEKLSNDAKLFSTTLDGEQLGLEASDRITSEISKLVDTPNDVELMERVERLVRLASRLPIQMNLWRAQNLFYSLAKRNYLQVKDQSKEGEEEMIRWIAAFKRLSNDLKVKARI